jgi:hypothetical protein
MNRQHIPRTLAGNDVYLTQSAATAPEIVMRFGENRRRLLSFGQNQKNSTTFNRTVVETTGGTFVSKGIVKLRDG